MRIKNSESTLFCGSSEVSDKSGVFLNNADPNIKLFKIELPQYYDLVDVLLKILTPDEVQRAHRYHHLKDSNRFIICRSFLKIIIAQQKDLEISQVYFEKSDNHKPYFPLDKGLFFNVSHAGNFAIIAIGDCELGVDVEYINPQFEYKDILPTVFNTEELNFIRDSEVNRHAFYKLWTRKEAIVKATGKGIDEDLIKIPVTNGFHNISSSLVCDFENLRVISFKLNANHLGAIAITRDDVEIDKISFQTNPTLNEIEALMHS
ncbi:4'-phosphopantetheinyl transferase family protein [Winogradskyella costae]|uniref:4'-phosphopantetheinyl transferase family protein n=1 Tax=Winogradskyella costae TaxID=2697008 RepID=UPI0015CBFEDE|nr:4'-phosphopantetheinyl transferase superfamily protein [Winogradskyella costae]